MEPQLHAFFDKHVKYMKKIDDAESIPNARVRAVSYAGSYHWGAW
jgi:hypothetical protein